MKLNTTAVGGWTGTADGTTATVGLSVWPTLDCLVQSSRQPLVVQRRLNDAEQSGLRVERNLRLLDYLLLHLLGGHLDILLVSHCVVGVGLGVG